MHGKGVGYPVNFFLSLEILNLPCKKPNDSDEVFSTGK
jgi:hypothetical protein